MFVSDRRGGITRLGADGAPGADPRPRRRRLPAERLLAAAGSQLRDRQPRPRGRRLAHDAGRRAGAGGARGRRPCACRRPTSSTPTTRRGALRLWVSVSTRQVPREQAFRSDGRRRLHRAEGRRGTRIVADGLGFTNENKIDPVGPLPLRQRDHGAPLSRFPIGTTAASGRARRSPSSAPESSRTASSSMPRAASGSRAWSATGCSGSRRTAARR